MRRSVGSPSTSAGPWAWWFPLAYGLHIAEEYSFDFPAYVASVSGRQLSDPQFLLINAVFWLLMVAAVVVVRARPSQAWLVVTLATVLGINAAIHIVGSVVTFSYSPGTATAAILYAPLVVHALRQVLPHVSRGAATGAAALGAAIHASALLLAAHPSLLLSP